MEKLTIAEIEALYGERLRAAGLTATAVNKRLERQVARGLPIDIEDALSPPRKQRQYEAFGERHTLVEWAERYKISDTTLRQRITKRGMTLEAALTEPLSSTRAPHGTQWSYAGKSMTMRQWARASNVRYVNLRAAVTRYMAAGLSEEEAMGKALDTIERRGTFLVLDGERQPLEVWAQRAKLDATTLRDRMDRGQSLRAIVAEAVDLTAFGVTAPLRRWAEEMQIKPQALLAVYSANKNKAHETVLRMADNNRSVGPRPVDALATAAARLREEQHAAV